jgi:DNA helicase-2/ATP-dependent DNA helicase PcrA
VANRDDDAAFDRVINTPPRGIGDRSLESVRALARAEDLSLWQAAGRAVETRALGPRAVAAVAGFRGLVDALARELEGLELHAMVEQVLARSGLLDHHRAEPGERGLARVENLEELVSAAREFDRGEDAGEDPLAAYLAHTALEAGEQQAGAGAEGVQLMTLHAAKGLEFPLVFLCGMEEGLFPHQHSVEDPARLEEERRLCYVGITRARERLYLTLAESRRLHGSDFCSRPSRFLRELPAKLLQEVAAGGAAARPVAPELPTRAAPGRSTRAAPGGAPFLLGQQVRHPAFGEGTVIGYEGSGAHARVQVSFGPVGSKWLVLAYARLQPA